ncbi:hypothetical protein A3D42_00535 [Candidatus Nomurabacteria bacterium RIFCSPHIGHO2_02_FULL_41_18]|uniref:Uncharacterized protein n=1 Tax=Candidatus Nomurabacteria bacterium RIFCSPHIGHO2_02_FULL_41_18 TaxID=1801754 RepID=A0A1F6W7I2_9BACT|nr:MAG: hypothetical protein A2737_02560 [Candidatus Nomurabacteria bacterium RIFCSPHIGHO2_01_FULL_41_71]OGI77907.1 MAG: hypothetical protein A3D42_00535 [Candidatus Nomurabacteria bacterium RIFCSPHIGHO2_02_FULL_41_18]OGI90081.1 MAG: hypothetical protein A3B01_00955 [Candidatus Nomurabacteria bacterium RIFCSPLOWO2_01_FULL_41_52b]OGJ00250.1 MAG: hypothetical protein A3I90_01740 [Candidatus Nomurabacteria bacterium RIFCSPLOWO2_02_FULL_41_9]
MNLLSPNIAYASLDSFLLKVNSQIVNPLIDFLFALAVAFFLYGVFSFIMNQNNEEKKTTGKKHMIWGVMGIAIMLSVWGILNMVLSTLEIPKSEIDPKEGKVKLREYNPPPINQLGT